jgi:outer membrane protein
MEKHTSIRKTGIVLASALLLQSGSAVADDLLSTYKLATENDQQYRAAVNIYEAEQAALGKSRANLLPFLGAGAGRTNRNQDTSSGDNITGIDGQADYNIDSWSVNLNQALIDLPAWHGYKQARVNVEKAAFNFSAAEQDLIYRVAEVYGFALVAQGNLKVSRAEKDALAEQLELDRERLNVGLGTATDLYATESRYSLAETSVIEADFALRDALVALKELTGQYPGELRNIAEDQPALEPPSPDEPDHWVSLSMDNNLELLAAEKSVEIAEREVSRIKAGHLPTLDLVASHANTETDGSLTGSGRTSETTDVGLQIDIPLISGWGVVAGTREARSLYQASLNQREGVRRRIDRSARSAYQAVKSGISRLRALDKAIISGESTVEARTEGYKAGVNTNLEVLDALRDLYGIQRDYINAKYQFMLSMLQLERVAGQLDYQDLVKVNGWLE